MTSDIKTVKNLQQKRLHCFVQLLCLLLFGSSFCIAQKAYNLRGTTTALPNTDCYRITNNRFNELGAVWYVDKIQIKRSFDLEFSMNFGDNDLNGADGMMFVIQTASNNALGMTGQGIGFAGFSPSLGIEFDTFQNGDENDPSYDHIAVVRDGIVNHSNSRTLAQPVQALKDNPNIEDGKNHNVRINWDAKKNRLEVYFDCEKRIDLSINLSQEVFFGQKEAWWGFTGATGGSTNAQTVCLNKDIVAKDTFQVCLGETIELVARNSIDNKYQWSPRNLLSNADSRSPTTQPTTSQLFLVNYLDFCNQPTRDSIFVEVARPSTLRLGGDRDVCEDEKFELKPMLTPAAPNAQFLWSSGDTTRNLPVNKSGKYVLNVAIGGCKTQDSATVQIRALPTVGSTDRRPLCLREAPLLLDPSAVGEGLKYSWKPTNQTTPTIEVTQKGSYSFEVRNRYNCLAQRSFEVTDNCPPVLYIPDVFTPNTDGQNDVFSVISPEKGEFRLIIYNRWGQAIFESNDINQPWHGKDQPGGIYVWKLTFKRNKLATDTPFDYTGSVLLLR